MSEIEIRGLRPIKGEITVQGSKNAVLPMMAAAILNQGITVIDNVPGIQDVFCMMGILTSLGCRCSLSGHRLSIDAGMLTDHSISKEEMGRMRSSIMLLGALLARQGQAVVYPPGGCMIGSRPIDLHLKALRQFGAVIESCDGCLRAQVSHLKGAVIDFSFPSVGATENALFAAVAAQGTTQLSGCAAEPEIEELCHFLNGMGACIRGVGTSRLLIEGGLPLHDSHFTVGGDRIVAGTYLFAAAGAGGELLLTGVRSLELSQAADALRRMGAVLYQEEDLIYLKAPGRLKAISVVTGPFPEFPTDLQSVLMAAMSLSQGVSRIEETVFENRFHTARELRKMGADIETKGCMAKITGRKKLTGARVEAGDLRGGAALTAAGLAAEGITVVSGCSHILRGYEDICRDLRSLGAEIRFIEDEDS